MQYTLFGRQSPWNTSKLFIFRVHARIRWNRLAFGLRSDVWIFSKTITDQRMIYYHYYRRIVSGSQKKNLSKSRSSLTRTCPSSSRRPGGCCCCTITPVVADDSPSTRKQHEFIPRKNNRKLIKLPFVFVRVLRNAFPTGKWQRDFSSDSRALVLVHWRAVFTFYVLTFCDFAFQI